MAEALYRKYRPQIFEDVVGQEPIERTLKNAIAQDKVSHAYLLCGPRGTGKTTTARLIAKALLCEHGPTASPDGTCEDCRMIADGVHPDVYELDAASRTGVENVREEIISRVQFAPTRGKYKVYIIDEVHMLSTAAFNALLKTLEEPPEHVIFILCTTDPQKVPETIHSRCQRFDFRRISPEAMVSRLGAVCVSEGVEFEGEALDLIAHRAEGGMRNALTSLEQIIAFEGGKVTLAGAERILGTIDSNDMADIVGAIGRRDAAACFRWVADYVETGADLVQFTRDLAEHVRNLYLMAVAGDDIELDVSETLRKELACERKLFGEDRLSRMLCVLGDLLSELKSSTNRRLSFEIALTRLVRPDSDLTIAGLAERVEALENGMSAIAMPVGDSSVGSFEPAVPASVAGRAQAAGAQGQARGQAPQPRPVQQQAPATQPQRAEEAPTEAQLRLQELQRERIYKQEQARQDAWRASSGAAPAAAPQQAPEQRVPGRQMATGAQAQGAQRVGSQAQPAPASAADFAPDDAGQRPSPSAAPQAFASQQAGVQAGAMSQRLLQALQNPAALQRMWQSALASIKKQKTAYGVLFMNTKAVLDPARGALVVEFPRENEFAFKSVQRAEVRDALALALQQAAGEPVAYELSQAGATARGVAPSAPQREPFAPPARQAPRAAAAGGRASTQAPAPAQQAAPGVPAQQPPAYASQAPVQRQAQVQRPVPGCPAASQPDAPAQAGAVDFRSRIPHASNAPSAPSTAPAPYDDVVPYGDDAVFDSGYDDSAAFEPPAFARQAPAPAQRSGAFPQGASRAAQQAGAPSHLGAQPADSQPNQQRQGAPGGFGQASRPGAQEPAAGDIEAMLQAGFGDGVVFKEVQ